MEIYFGNKLIFAEPQEKDGVQGYKVKYDTLYESWLPEEVFEEVYQQSGEMNFGHALEALKRNFRVSRTGWNEKGLWLELQTPDAHSKMTLPYIYLNYPDDAKTTPGCRVPWFPSQTDMLANDWCILKRELKINNV